MRRLFFDSDRALIYLLARGKCSICGCMLNPANWHADHVQPFSHGGVTHISNGQALCPSCNLSKGSTPPHIMQPIDYVPGGSSLHTWQMEFVDRFIPYAKAQIVRPIGEAEAFILNAFPGSGKTWAQLLSMKYLKNEGFVDFLVVCVPTKALRTQFGTEAVKFGLNLHYKANLKVDFQKQHGIVLTYGQLRTESTVAMLDMWAKNMKMFVSADEMHHLSVKKSWGENFFRAFDKTRVRLLTSGTPFRTDGHRIPWVRYLGNSIDLSAPGGYSYGYGRNKWNARLSALSDGVVRDVVFHSWDGIVKFRYTDGHGVDEEFEHRFTDNLYDEYPDRTPRQIESLSQARRLAAIECGTPAYPNGTEYVQHQIRAAHENLVSIRRTHPWAGGLIVCEDRSHADSVASALENLTNTQPVVIHGEEDSPHEKINLFRQDKTAQRAPWIVAVRMVSEGIDIPHLRVLVYLTTTTAPLTWTQILGRILRKEVGIGEQCAHFYQYDDGYGYPKDERGRLLLSEIPTDINIRLYAKTIKEEREATVRDPRPEGPPRLCPVCKDEDSSFYIGKCPGRGISPCPVPLPSKVESLGATGEAKSQFYDGDEHDVEELDKYDPIAVRWEWPSAKVKSHFDKLPPQILEELLETLR